MTELKLDRTALIDADVIAYQMAARAHSHQDDVMEMTENIKALLHDWTSRAFCSDAIILLSCSREDNFRKEWWPLYKEHRTADPPAMLDTAKQVLWDTASKKLKMNRLEADDLMGILATNGKIGNPVIVSIDKDMRQIPGWNFNPNKEDFPVFISEEQADFLFYQQWLTGDSTDGFGGIKGLGPAKAKKLLKPFAVGDELRLDTSAAHHDIQSMIAEQYAKAGKGKKVKEINEYMLGMARCARILRADDFDSEKKAVIPWTPTVIVAEEG